MDRNPQTLEDKSKYGFLVLMKEDTTNLPGLLIFSTLLYFYEDILSRREIRAIVLR